VPVRDALVDEVLNLVEASRYLRIKPRTLYTLAARGMVPGAKIGGQWRFLRSQLEALFEDDPPSGRPPIEVEESS
jgi:excisionase family DNA binding protein